MLLSQIKTKNGKTQLVVREGTEAYTLSGVSNLLDLVKTSMNSGLSLSEQINHLEFDQAVDLPRLYKGDSLISPINLPADQKIFVAEVDDGLHMSQIAEINIVNDNGALFRLGYCQAYFLPQDFEPKHNLPFILPTLTGQIMLSPEIYLGELPQNINGVLTAYRGRQLMNETPFTINRYLANESKPDLDTLDVGVFFVQLYSTYNLDRQPYTEWQDGDIFDLKIPLLGLQLKNPWLLGAQKNRLLA